MEDVWGLSGFKSSVDLVVIVRLAYIGAALGVLFVSIAPPLRSRFLAYGARTSAASQSQTSKASTNVDKKYEGRDNGVLITLLDRAAAIRVPHNWFISFYVISVAGSMFWATELIRRGSGFQFVARLSREANPSMNFTQVQAVWALMFVQGSRRLYECLSFSKPSKSQMWIGHWILGVVFYAATSVAVWIEGINALKDHQYSSRDINFSAPSLRSFVATLIFILASGVQHDCHAHLASLKEKPRRSDAAAKQGEYRIPTHPAFHKLIAPHYTAECLIYLSLAMLGAPGNGLWNHTLLCALVFVVINLGITAAMTKEWYASRFGEAAIAGKWRMIPWTF